MTEVLAYRLARKSLIVVGIAFLVRLMMLILGFPIAHIGFVDPLIMETWIAFREFAIASLNYGRRLAPW